jgi:beta-lactamase regulating signal transducer with metallopeptidase domain
VDVVLNWLWQGVVVAAAAAAVLRTISPSRPQARYCALWAACIAVLALPAMPFVWTAAAPVDTAGDRPTSIGPLVSVPLGWWTSPFVAMVLWVTWSTIYAIRVAAAALALRHAKRHCREVAPDVAARLPHWMRVRTTGRRTRIVLSNNVRSAAVLGWRSPVIAVAPALLDHLSNADLDRVVIHEWAHVQRRDDVAQIAQLLVRLVAGWHPALWWLERQLRAEREVACDDMTVTVTGSAREYAACLATLASLPAMPIRSLAAPAAVGSSGLRRRIVRILAARHIASTWSGHATAIGAGVLLALLAVAIGGICVVETAFSTADLPTAVRAAPAHAVAVRPSMPWRAITQPLPPALTHDRSRLPARRAAPGKAENNAARPPKTAMAAPAAPTAPTRDVARSLFREQLLEPVTSGSGSTFAALDVPDSPLEMRPETFVAPGPSAADVKAPARWEAAVKAGMAVSRGSENGAVATAGFFTRFAKKIARSF